MRKRLPLLAALVLLLALGGSARALDPQAGTSGAQFLKLGSGARAGGMADSFSAVSDDASAMYYNPAGLTQIKGTQIGGAHTSYFQGIKYETLNLAVPFGEKTPEFSRHVIGFGIYQLSVSDLERRASDTTDPIGSFGANDGAYSLSYAYSLDRHLRAGVTGKYINETIDTFKASAYALDAGVLFTPKPDAKTPVTLAAVLRNWGTRTGFVAGQSDPLPASMTFGASAFVVPKALRLNVEVVKYRDTALFGALGGEWNHPFSDSMSGALRFGYTSERATTPGLNGITAGGGISFQKMAFDFAWIPFGVLGDTFRYSLLIKF
jgi:hypothetical protein